jgi:type IV fimbrial biogenesis protein FimT
MRGFTLIEMLAVLLIVGVVLGIGVPSMQDLMARTRADSAIFQLQAMLGLARQNAITMNRDITVCGTRDGKRCSAEWREQPALLFLDTNANRTLDGAERLILLSEATSRAGIRWRGSGGRPYLRYSAAGGVREFGHFIYCPDDGDLRFARQLVVNATGRPRLARDTDGDGIVDDGSAPLRCG